jgi:hypothetical protein
VAGGADSGRAVDGKTDVALAGELDRAGVDSDSNPELDVLRPGRAGESLLRRDGRENRVARSGEGHEERIALRIQLAPPVHLEGCPEDLVVARLRRRITGAELAQQARRLFDVAEEEGQCLARRLRHRGAILALWPGTATAPSPS